MAPSTPHLVSGCQSRAEADLLIEEAQHRYFEFTGCLDARSD
jgi:hypothetical protein